MNKIIFKIGMIVIGLVSYNYGSAYDFETDGIAYDILSVQDLTCSVTRGDTEYFGNIIIPASVKFQNKDLSVIAIGDNCFEGCTKLLSVNIPSSVRSIGDNCFEGCTKLLSVNIPSSVRSIGKKCFADCSNIESVQLSSEITTIPEGCFLRCSTMNDIKMPPSVNSIGKNAFCSSGIISIQIPKAVTILPDYCFSGCTRLESVDIHSSVSSLGKECFAGCSSLKTIQLPYSITSLPYGCFYSSGLESVEILESVTAIGGWCFAYCYNLTRVHIPTSIKTIGRNCFGYCESLKSVTIPSSVEKLHTTFYECENLAYAATGASTISTQSFYGTNLKSLKLCKGTKIIEVAYHSSNGLVDAFPHDIKCLEIEDSEDEITVGYITYSDKFSTDFSEYLYCWTEKVENLYVGTKIKGAGLKCPNLKELTIGSQLTELMLGSLYSNIGNYTNLISLVSLNLIPPAIGTPTNLQYSTLEVVVPDEALEIYEADPVWGNFWNLKSLSGTQTISATPVREVTGYYDLSGRKVDESFCGMVIVRFSDGSAKKMIQK